MFLRASFVLLAALVTYDVSSGFLFQSNCIAPSPCTCSSNTIDCGYSHLTEIPSFTVHNEHFYGLIINLQRNQLTTLSENTFKNLSFINATYIKILLDRNHLYQIDLHAFAGIENAVIHLDLRYNNFTQLPAGLIRLTALEFLFLVGNPITNLDTTTMSSFGLTLLSLDISLADFAVFPSELYLLNRLRSLELKDVPYSRLNTSILRGLDNTALTILEMSFTHLEKLPALCHLTHLQKFTLNSSPYLNKNSIALLEDCNRNLSSITSLILEANQLTTFPNVSTLFPNILTLHLSSNNLTFIESSSLKDNLSLIDLYLEDNKFVRIPTAVNKLENLQGLYLSFNQILSVEDCDLQSLVNLQKIDLSNNPLVYISSAAFQHNPLIDEILLSETRLGSIPEAVTGLAHLHYFDLTGNPVDCSCSKMSSLKSWNVTSMNMYIYSDCSSGEDVKTFLTISLPKCP